ncbi:MAG: ABC transporter permease [Calditrichaeota bacterium]|nr:ABC transporter permease [Calditrichota bacterium]MBT7789213.1 ABC transporter permease [Calditrichota bacterium]
MIAPVLYLIRKEFLQIFRDHAMRGIIFVVPLIQLMIFSYAVTTDLKDIRIAILDNDKTIASRNLISALVESDYFKLVSTAPNPKHLRHNLLTSDADVTLWIPLGFSEDLATGNGAQVALNVDGSNSSIALRALGYTEAVVRLQAMKSLESFIQASITIPSNQTPSTNWDLQDEDQIATSPRIVPQIMNPRLIEPVMRFFYNPTLESRYYMIPGILVLLITLISAFLTGMAVVKEKELGTLEQLMVSPLTPAQLIAGKTIPFVVLAYFELAVATTFAILWFKLPLVGSIPLLALCALVYLLVTLGVGLLVSTISNTQQQAMFTVWFFLIFGILMSGFFFPIENMPVIIQKITVINPLRYFIEIIRGIFLRGATFDDVLPNLLPMLVIGLVIFSAAIMRFRKRTK